MIVSWGLSDDADRENSIEPDDLGGAEIKPPRGGRKKQSNALPLGMLVYLIASGRPNSYVQQLRPNSRNICIP